MSLRMTFLGCKIGKKAGRRFASLRGRERIYNAKFSNVNALRKGSSGTRSQEETVYSLAKLRGTLRPLWVMTSYFM